MSLRQLGFSLDEVRDGLDRSDFSLLEVLELHAVRDFMARASAAAGS